MSKKKKVKVSNLNTSASSQENVAQMLEFSAEALTKRLDFVSTDVKQEIQYARSVVAAQSKTALDYYNNITDVLSKYGLALDVRKNANNVLSLRIVTGEQLKQLDNNGLIKDDAAAYIEFELPSDAELGSVIRNQIGYVDQLSFGYDTKRQVLQYENALIRFLKGFYKSLKSEDKHEGYVYDALQAAQTSDNLEHSGLEYLLKINKSQAIQPENMTGTPKTKRGTGTPFQKVMRASTVNMGPALKEMLYGYQNKLAKFRKQGETPEKFLERVVKDVQELVLHNISELTPAIADHYGYLQSDKTLWANIKSIVQQINEQGISMVTTQEEAAKQQVVNLLGNDVLGFVPQAYGIGRTAYQRTNYLPKIKKVGKLKKNFGTRIAIAKVMNNKHAGFDAKEGTNATYVKAYATHSQFAKALEKYNEENGTTYNFGLNNDGVVMPESMRDELVSYRDYALNISNDELNREAKKQVKKIRKRDELKLDDDGWVIAEDGSIDTIRTRELDNESYYEALQQLIKRRTGLGYEDIIDKAKGIKVEEIMGRDASTYKFSAKVFPKITGTKMFVGESKSNVAILPDDVFQFITKEVYGGSARKNYGNGAAKDLVKKVQAIVALEDKGSRHIEEVLQDFQEIVLGYYKQNKDAQGVDGSRELVDRLNQPDSPYKGCLELGPNGMLQWNATVITQKLEEADRLYKEGKGLGRAGLMYQMISFLNVLSRDSGLIGKDGEDMVQFWKDGKKLEGMPIDKLVAAQPDIMAKNLLGAGPINLADQYDYRSKLNVDYRARDAVSREMSAVLGNQAVLGNKQGKKSPLYEVAMSGMDVEDDDGRGGFIKGGIKETYQKYEENLAKRISETNASADETFDKKQFLQDENVVSIGFGPGHTIDLEDESVLTSFDDSMRDIHGHIKPEAMERSIFDIIERLIQRKAALDKNFRAEDAKIVLDVGTDFSHTFQKYNGSFEQVRGQVVVLPSVKELGNQMEDDGDNTILSALGGDFLTLMNTVRRNHTITDEAARREAMSSAIVKWMDSDYNDVYYKEGKKFQDRYVKAVDESKWFVPQAPAIPVIQQTDFKDGKLQDSVFEKMSEMDRKLLMGSSVQISEQAAKDMLWGDSSEQLSEKVSRLEKAYEDITHKAAWGLTASLGPQASYRDMADLMIEEIIDAITLTRDEKTGMLKNIRGMKGLYSRYPLSEGEDERFSEIYVNKTLKDEGMIASLGLMRLVNGDVDGDHNALISLYNKKFKSLRVTKKSNSFKKFDEDFYAMLGAQSQQTQAVAIEEIRDLVDEYGIQGATQLINGGKLQDLSKADELNYSEVQAKINKAFTGRFSTTYQKIADTMTQQNIDELANNGLPGGRLKAIQAILTREFFSSITQDAISSKKIFNRLTKKFGNAKENFEDGTEFMNDLDNLQAMIHDAGKYDTDPSHIKKIVQKVQQIGIFGDDSEGLISTRRLGVIVPLIQQLAKKQGSNEYDVGVLSQIFGVGSDKESIQKIVDTFYDIDEHGNVTGGGGKDLAKLFTTEVMVNALTMMHRSLDNGIGWTIANPSAAVKNQSGQNQSQNGNRVGSKATPEETANAVDGVQKEYEEATKALNGAAKAQTAESKTEEAKIGVAEKEAKAIEKLGKAYKNYGEILEEVANQTRNLSNVSVSKTVAQKIPYQQHGNAKDIHAFERFIDHTAAHWDDEKWRTTTKEGQYAVGRVQNPNMYLADSSEMAYARSSYIRRVQGIVAHAAMEASNFYNRLTGGKELKDITPLLSESWGQLGLTKEQQAAMKEFVHKEDGLAEAVKNFTAALDMFYPQDDKNKPGIMRGANESLLKYIQRLQKTDTTPARILFNAFGMGSRAAEVVRRQAIGEEAGGPGHIVGSEINQTAVLGNKTKSAVQGRMDVVYVDPEGNLVVGDLKTGKDAHTDPHNIAQIAMYNIGLRQAAEDILKNDYKTITNFNDGAFKKKSNFQLSEGLFSEIKDLIAREKDKLINGPDGIPETDWRFENKLRENVLSKIRSRIFASTTAGVKTYDINVPVLGKYGNTDADNRILDAFMSTDELPEDVVKELPNRVQQVIEPGSSMLSEAEIARLEQVKKDEAKKAAEAKKKERAEKRKGKETEDKEVLKELSQSIPYKLRLQGMLNADKRDVDYLEMREKNDTITESEREQLEVLKERIKLEKEELNLINKRFETISTKGDKTLHYQSNRNKIKQLDPENPTSYGITKEDKKKYEKFNLDQKKADDKDFERKKKAEAYSYEQKIAQLTRYRYRQHQINAQRSTTANERELMALNMEDALLSEEMQKIIVSKDKQFNNGKNPYLSQGAVDEINQKYDTQDQLAQLKINSQNRGRLGIWDQVGDQFGMAIQRVINYGAAMKIVQTIPRTLHKIITLSVQLDDAMTNLRVVTRGSREETLHLMRGYNGLAQQLGVTTQEVAKSADAWLRQGYSIEESNKLIVASTHLAKLGQVDAAQASKYMTSMLKGFRLEAAEAMSVVDKLVALDKQYAVTAGGIAEALSRTAVSAQMAGVEMDKIAAMVTVIADVSQKSTDSIGESMKTLFSRYGNVKAGVFEDLMDTTGEATGNLNDIERVLSSIGISIRSSSMEFRDMDSVLEELSDRWLSLTSVEKNAVATAMAGTRQRENFNVMMENYDEILRATEISANAAGTAEEGYSVITESVTYQLNQLKAAWEGVALSMDANPLFSSLIKAGTWLVSQLPRIIHYTVKLFTLTNSYRLPGLFKNIGGFITGKGMSGKLPSIWTKKGREARAQMLAGKEPVTSNVVQQGVNDIVDAVNDVEKELKKEDKKNDKQDKQKEKEDKAKDQKDRQDEGNEADAKDSNMNSTIVGAIASGVVGAISGATMYGDNTTESGRTKSAVGGLAGAASGILSNLGWKGMIAALAIDFGNEVFQALYKSEEDMRMERVQAAEERLSSLQQVESVIDAISDFTVNREQMDAEGMASLSDNIAEVTQMLLENDTLREKALDFLAQKNNNEVKYGENTNVVSLLDKILHGTEQEARDIAETLKYITAISKAEEIKGTQEDRRFRLQQDIKKNSRLSFLQYKNEDDKDTRTPSTFRYATAIPTELLKEYAPYLSYGKIDHDFGSNGTVRTVNLNIAGSAAKERVQVLQNMRQTIQDMELRESEEWERSKTVDAINNSIIALQKIIGQQELLNAEINKPLTQAALIQSSISSWDTARINRTTLNEAVNVVAEQLMLEGASVRGFDGNITDDARRYITDALRADKKYSGLFTNENYNLRDVVIANKKTKYLMADDKFDDIDLAMAKEAFDTQKTTQIDDWKAKGIDIDELRHQAFLHADSVEMLERYATALGYTVEEVQKLQNTLGDVTLGDLLAPPDKVVEKYSQLNSILSDISSNGKMSINSLQTVLTTFSDLLVSYNKDSGEIESVSTNNIIKRLPELLGLSSDNQGGGLAAVYQKSLYKQIQDNDKIFSMFVKTLNNGQDKQFLEGHSSFDEGVMAYIRRNKDLLKDYKEFIKELNVTTEELVDSTTDIMIKSRQTLIKQETNRLTEIKKAIQDTNKEREIELNLLKAKEQLLNAQNEKVMVYREGVGFTYEANNDTIQKAQEEIDKLEKEQDVQDVDYRIAQVQNESNILDGIKENNITEQANNILKALGSDNSGIFGLLKQIEQNIKPVDAEHEHEETMDNQVGSSVKSVNKILTQEKNMTDLEKFSGGVSRHNIEKMNLQNALKSQYGSDTINSWKDSEKNSDKRAIYDFVFGDNSGSMKKTDVIDLTHVNFNGDQTAETKNQNINNTDKFRHAENGRTPQSTLVDILHYKDGKKSSPVVWRRTDKGTWEPAHDFVEREDGTIKSEWADAVESQGWAQQEGTIIAIGSPTAKNFVPRLFHKTDQGWVELVKSNAAVGSYGLPGGLTMVNEPYAGGTETIVTPQGTLTALPSKTGVVPAELTRNLFELGVVAPNLVRELNSPNHMGINADSHNTVEDNSTNIHTLNATFEVDETFDFDKFLSEVRGNIATTRHNM